MRVCARSERAENCIVWVLALLAGQCVAAPDAGIQWQRDAGGRTASGAGLMAEHWRLQLPLHDVVTREEQLQIRLQLQGNRFRWQGVNAADGDYLWAGVRWSYQQWRSTNSQLRLSLEPGVMAAGVSAGSDSLAVNLGLLWRQFGDADGFWQAGVVVDRRFGDMDPRPALAFAGKFGTHSEWLLGFPETRLETAWAQDWRSWVRIAPDGGVWVESVPGQPGISRVQYSNWVAALGGRLQWRQPLWITFEMGWQRGRWLQATDSTGVVIETRPPASYFWQAGLGWSF